MNSATASVLVEPLDAYLHRRDRSGLMLSPGEAVTAVIGLLRGCRGLEHPERSARWWLTSDGRPAAADDEGAGDIIAETSDSLGTLVTLIRDPETRRLTDFARESVVTLPPRDWDALERRLLRHATPQPLVLGPLTPAAPGRVPEEERAAPAGVLRLLDPDLAHAVMAAGAGAARRWRTSRALRLAVVGVVAAAAAIGILAALPVSSDPPPGAIAPTSASAPTGSRTPTLTPTPFPTPPADERVPLSDDVVDQARAVLMTVSSCLEPSPCAASAWENGSITGDPLLPVDAESPIALVDDFGGVTVVRLTAGESEQYVTLVRRNDRWLVRAVRTVADQPS